VHDGPSRGTITAVNEVAAFSPEQVRRLTGLSDRQLRYWDDTGFFAPTFREGGRHSPYARVYSFRDVVGLRALATLRKDYGIPLQRLRRVGEELHRRYGEPWAALTFYVVGDDVFYQDQEREAIRRADETGQEVMPFELTRVERDVRARVDALRRRSPQQVGKIRRNRYVADDQPVLDGTRIPTAAIWEFHEDGYRVADILRQYPQLTAEDVGAAIDFEAERRRRRKAG